MNKVLHVLNSMNVGGAETFIMNVFRNIDHSRVQFDFLLNEKENFYAEEIASLGGKIFFILPRHCGFLRYHTIMKQFFKNHQGEYIAIHQHLSSLSSIEPLAAACQFGYPIRIAHSHSSSAPKSLLHRGLHYCNKLRIAGVATHYLGCSDLALRWVFGHTSAFPGAQMVNNGINTAAFAYNETTRQRLRRQLKLDGKLVFGHVGRFCEMKNHHFLLKVFERFLQINPQAHLLLVGTGPLLPASRQLAQEWNIDKQVSFLGLRSDVAELLQAMEAQCAGLKVYCSDRITRDIALTDNIKFLDIASPAERWASFIASDYDGYIRRDVSQIIVDSGFGIGKTIQFLMDHLYCPTHE